MKCQIKGCKKCYQARGYCWYHYTKLLHDKGLYNPNGIKKVKLSPTVAKLFPDYYGVLERGK